MGDDELTDQPAARCLSEAFDPATGRLKGVVLPMVLTADGLRLNVDAIADQFLGNPAPPVDPLRAAEDYFREAVSSGGGYRIDLFISHAWQVILAWLADRHTE